MTDRVLPPPLSPLTWLERAELIFAERTAVVDGDSRFSWREFAAQCWGGAKLLIDSGVEPGDRVGILGPNSLMLLEAHFAVPAAGAVIVCINPRLSAEEVAFIIEHSGLSVLLVDVDSVELAREACRRGVTRPGSVQIVSAGEYFARRLPGTRPAVQIGDELAPIAINYTSGTTGRPKGVVVTHRSVFLQALAMSLHMRIGLDSVYLWTLPMFHANGWAFTWAMAAVGCPSVILTRPDAGAVWAAVQEHGVTHLCAAPTVLTGLVSGPSPAGPRPVTVAVGGSPPSPALIARIRALGWQVIHLYGLTETGGPAVICLPQPEWQEFDDQQLAAVLARQGVPNVVTNGVHATGADGQVAAPGSGGMGEIRVRGQSLFTGYWHDPAATRQAMADGWLHTGDVGVQHADGYVEVLDREKDVIISGGENISSVEVERVLDSHPAVLECAVVAAPDDRWGEAPVAVVTRRAGAEVDEVDLIDFVKSRIARFKAPRRVIFAELPKSETGKILKHELRAQLWAGTDRRIQ